MKPYWIALMAGGALLLAVACLGPPSGPSPGSAGTGCQTPPPDPAPLAGPRRLIPPVPAGHPRVYVRPADLPLIREKVASPEFRAAWAEVQEGARSRDFGYVFQAFVYLVNGDRAAGRQAIGGALAALRRSRRTETFGEPFHLAALAYDWTYDLLTADEKKQFVAEFIRTATNDPDGPCYPALPHAPGVVGHITGGPILTGQLPVGVAIYDESRTMYDAAALTFFNTFKPVRDFSYEGHSYHGGDSYGPGPALHDQAASWLFRRMGAGDVLSRQQQFLPYRMLYDIRPDSRPLRWGDSFDELNRHPSKALLVRLTAAYYDDPVLLGVAQSPLLGSAAPFSGLFDLLFRSPGLRERAFTDLPLTKYFAEPIGTMIARTGWAMGPESDDVTARMHIGQFFFGNHQHVGDFGTFQLYYRGGLAVTSGVYVDYGDAHWRNFYHQTISRNGLLIFDPAERRRYASGPVANDGGTRWPNDGHDHPASLEVLKTKGYEMGRVLAHEAGPDPRAPDFSYIAGDLTLAYTEKVRRVTRAMVLLNHRQPVYRASMVVFDRVEASNPSFRKTWLLHAIQPPTLDGRTITVVRNEKPYGGKLIVASLLPERASLAVVGGPGRTFWVESTRTNYQPTKPRPPETGAWRVEVSPDVPAARDQFLHVLTATQAATAGGPSVERVTSPSVTGARVLDRVVLFGANGDLLRRAGFTAPGAGGLRFLVCDLQPGRWTARRNGGAAPVASAVVGAAGRCFSFSGPGGTYELALE